MRTKRPGGPPARSLCVIISAPWYSAAAEIPLTPAEIAGLDAAIPPGAAQGTRYPAAQMAAVHR